MTDETYRVRFVYDHDPMSALHDPEGNPLPGPRDVYERNPITPNGGPALTYDEYCAYHGNPERHMVLGCIVDRVCPCCGQWDRDVEALWGIDLMDDDPGTALLRIDAQDHFHALESYTPDEARALPGYLGEVAAELLEEAQP